MFAVNLLRRLSYFQWLSVVVQLGYIVYASYKTYQEFYAQYEADSRRGTKRTFKETLELVVKPRRRRGANSNQATSNPPENQENRQQDDSNSATDPSTDQTGAISGTKPIALGWSSHIYPSTSPHEDREKQQKSCNTLAIVASTSQAGAIHENGPMPIGRRQHPVDDGSSSTKTKIKALGDISNDVTIYDSSRPNDAQATSNNPHQADETNETESFSTSLESTDSNKGVISDIYSECFICARSLDDPRKAVATLPFCMHPFHQTCLDGVLKWHPRCPVCDFHIFSPI